MRLPRQRFAAPNQALFQAYGFVLRIARRPRLPPQIRRCFSPVRRLCGGLFNKKQKPQNEVKTKEKNKPTP